MTEYDPIADTYNSWDVGVSWQRVSHRRQQQRNAVINLALMLMAYCATLLG